jgi:hypothetical protein
MNGLCRAKRIARIYLSTVFIGNKVVFSRHGSAIYSLLSTFLNYTVEEERMGGMHSYMYD